MHTIKQYKYTEYDKTVKVECIATWMLENEALFRKGYRLYCGENDVTGSKDDILKSKNLMFMRPAEGSNILGGLLVNVAIDAVVKLFTPDVAAPAYSDRSQTSSTNTLGSRNNTFNVGARIDDVWGNVNGHIPRLMQEPHFRFTDNVEEEYFALYISEGKGLIENVKDGDTDFSRLGKSKFNSWNPGGNPNDGTPADFNVGGLINRPLVNIQKSRELQSAELLPPNDLDSGAVDWFFTGLGVTGEAKAVSVEPDFDLNDYFAVDDIITMLDVFYFEIDGSETLYRYSGPNILPKAFDTYSNVDLSTQTYKVISLTTDTLTIEITGMVGDAVYDAWQLMSNYQMKSIYYQAISVSHNFLTLDASITSFGWFSSNALAPTLTEPVTVTTLNLNASLSQNLSGVIGPYIVDPEIDSITFNVVADNGFYKLLSNNDTAITADFQLIIDELDLFNVPTGNTTIHPFQLMSNQPNVTAQAAITTDQLMNDYTRQQVSFRRVSNRDKGSSVSNVDKAILRDLYFIKDLETVPDYGSCTVAQVVIESSPASRGVKERQVRLDWTRIITPYIGGGNFGPEATVDTIAETIIGIALDPFNGRLNIDEIDADLFLTIQQQIIDYYGNADFVKVGYVLDSTKLRFQEIYNLFWNAVRCNAYSQGAVYRAYPNIERLESSKQFTHRSKILGTDSKERVYDKDKDGVELTYRSNSTRQFETVIRHVNGVSSVNRLKIELSGATQEIQAVTRANYELNIIKFQKLNYSFTADGIARLTVPGERVDNVDNTRIVKRENNLNTYNIYDGEIVAINGLEVELSQPVTFEVAETHSIRFTNPQGQLLEAIECNVGPTPYHVILSMQPSESVYEGYKQEKAAFTFASDVSRLQLPILILGTKPKESKGLRTRQLTGINYDSRYFTNDKDFA